MTDRLDKMAQRVSDLGLALIQGIAFIGHAARLIAQSFHLLFRGPAIGQPIRLRHVVQEIIAGIQSLPVVILMASTIGVMLSIQGIHSLRIFGAETQVSFGLALSIPREFAPLITGIIVAGRSGSQLASRVGSMRLNGEIDALTVMGISPIRFIVAPALFGLLISLPILVAVATVASLTAGQLYIEATIGRLAGFLGGCAVRRHAGRSCPVLARRSVRLPDRADRHRQGPWRVGWPQPHPSGCIGASSPPTRLSRCCSRRRG